MNLPDTTDGNFVFSSVNVSAFCFFIGCQKLRLPCKRTSSANFWHCAFAFSTNCARLSCVSFDATRPVQTFIREHGGSLTRNGLLHSLLIYAMIFKTSCSFLFLSVILSFLTLAFVFKKMSRIQAFG